MEKVKQLNAPHKQEWALPLLKELKEKTVSAKYRMALSIAIDEIETTIINQ